MRATKKSKRLCISFLLFSVIVICAFFFFVTKPYPTVTNVPIMQIIIPIGLFSAIIMPIPIKKITPIIAVNKKAILNVFHFFTLQSHFTFTKVRIQLYFHSCFYFNCYCIPFALIIEKD